MSGRTPESKLLSREEAIERFGRPRQDRVVFTNGCFDLLHRGHVSYLNAAKALGASLVVGVNTDASVRRLNKGSGRPFVSQEDRAYLLASLECVDAVCIFDEDTPLRLISALLPDVLVKGADYAIDQVVGREAVEAAGGLVVLVPLVSGYSTSALLQRIRKKD
jgi:D-beta-D-heptose 7-phosphate kinase/D-beta-D-heptose 1-phosphate adenosyltransferase